MGDVRISGKLHAMIESSSLPFCEETVITKPDSKGPRAKGPRGQKRPFTFDELVYLNFRLKENVGKKRLGLRDLVLFSVEIDTLLRAENGLSLKVKDVMNSLGDVREFIDIEQCKSHRPVTCALTIVTQERLRQWISEQKLKPDDFLFPGKYEDTHLGRGQLANIVKSWAKMLGKPPENYATHSLRRSKAAIAWGKHHDAEEVRILLGQQSIACVHAYLGVFREQALKTALSIDPFSPS